MSECSHRWQCVDCGAAIVRGNPVEDAASLLRAILKAPKPLALRDRSHGWFQAIYTAWYNGPRKEAIAKPNKLNGNWPKEIK